MNKNLKSEKAYIDFQFHYFKQENIDYSITVFKGNAKLLDNIKYSYSLFKSVYNCLINKTKDLWIKKGDKVSWHYFQNYDSKYSISKKEIIVHLKKRHYN